METGQGEQQDRRTSKDPTQGLEQARRGQFSGELKERQPDHHPASHFNDVCAERLGEFAEKFENPPTVQQGNRPKGNQIGRCDCQDDKGSFAHPG